jgi:hypothetical protein
MTIAQTVAEPWISTVLGPLGLTIAALTACVWLVRLWQAERTRADEAEARFRAYLTESTAQAEAETKELLELMRTHADER